VKYKVARFKVRASEVAKAEKAIIAFIGAVADEAGTLRYESFREADGVSYLHLMAFADDKAEAAHRNTEHMKKFVAVLHPLCEVQPSFSDVIKVSGAGR
jgi:quinol monooxygenase YgiN